jgi:organic hydroperoxide reductase OsmC/OhrA
LPQPRSDYAGLPPPLPSCRTRQCRRHYRIVEPGRTRETLLSAAVADCFILSFRAIARASKFDWISLTCDVDAVLERVDKVTRFTAFHETVVLEVPPGTDEGKAMRLLEKAEHVCLVTNSLTGKTQLDATVKVAD